MNHVERDDKVKLAFVFTSCSMFDSKEEAIDSAFRCVEYFGRIPSENSILWWLQNMRYHTVTSQSVGIVAWDGDE